MQLSRLKIISTLIVQLAFVWRAEAVYLPPQITQIEQQVNYLLYLHEQAPRIFEQGAEYDVDFLALIQSQNILVNHLLQDNDFATMNGRVQTPLRELDIWLKQTQGTTYRYELNKDLLTRDVKRSGAVEYYQLPMHIDHILKHPVRSILTALLSLSPPQIKSEGFRLKSNADILKFISTHPLSNEILAQKFKPEKVGLKSSQNKWDSIIEICQDLVMEELDVLHTLLDLSQAATKKKYREIFGPTSTELERFNMAIANLGLSEEQKKKFLDFRSEVVKEYYDKTEPIHRHEDRKVLTLREVPPAIGIFRGVAGSDCSTNYSFPYVYSPMEHTFFVYSQEGELLGYVMSTLVNATAPGARKPTSSLYVHTISGPDISARQVALILHSLKMEASQFGAEQVIVPPYERVYANINYVAIQKALQELINTEESYQVSYLDSELRANFENWPLGMSVSSDYDSPTSNSEGHPVYWNENLEAELRVDVDRYSPPALRADRKLDLRTGVLIGLDLLTSERSAAARAHLLAQIAEIRAAGMEVNQANYAFRRNTAQIVLNQFGIVISNNKTPFALLDKALANPTKLPIGQYYMGLAPYFATYGISVDEGLLADRAYLFYEGHLLAPDALTNPDAAVVKRSIEFLILMIKRWDRPEIAWKAIAAAPEVVMKSEKFKKYVQSLFLGDSNDYGKLMDLRGAKYSFAGIDYQAARAAALDLLESPGVSTADATKIHRVLKKLLADHPEIGEDISDDDCDEVLSR